MKLSKNFSLNEMLVTSTGVANIPTDKEIGCMRTLAERILQPTRNWMKRPVIVTSSYRSKFLFLCETLYLCRIMVSVLLILKKIRESKNSPSFLTYYNTNSYRYNLFWYNGLNNTSSATFTTNKESVSVAIVTIHSSI